MKKYALQPEMLDEIIAGVEMDLTISEYATFEDLRLYCYRVASAVGLVSIEIFGYRNPACRKYAIELGLALQTTNILRDVGKDLDNGRIYLPLADLARFGYSAAALRSQSLRRAFCSPDAVRGWTRARVFCPCRGVVAVRRSTFDDRSGDHGLSLSRPPATNGTGQVPRFRKSIPAQQVREARPGYRNVIQVSLNFGCPCPSDLSIGTV